MYSSKHIFKRLEIIWKALYLFNKTSIGITLIFLILCNEY